MLLHPEDTPSLFALRAPGVQPVQSPDGSVSSSSSSSLGLNGTFSATGLSGNGPQTQFAQGLNSEPLVSDQLATSSPLGSQQNQVQSQLCFDYTSSSDYDSDHYNHRAPYPFFAQPMTSYAMSNASDELGDQDMNAFQDTIGSMSTPMAALSSEGVSSLYSVMPGFNTSSPMTMPLMEAAPSLSSTDTKASSKPDDRTSSPASFILPAGQCSGSAEEADMNGCGCAVSASMCCCGELCACPGCLAYPNNQGILDTSLPSTMLPKEVYDSNGKCGMNMAQGTPPKGSCCATRKNNPALNDPSALYNTGSTQALNLSQALSLIEASSQNASAVMDNDVRQALRQGLMLIGHAGTDTVKMQHPTLLGDSGILTCGCGCGRPTVDCADCFRDMCEFVGESHARMMKEELELEMAMNRESGYLADLGLNMNMSMAMNMKLDAGLEMNTDAVNNNPRPEGPLTPSAPYQDRQQEQQLMSSLDQPQYQNQLSNHNQTLSQFQQMGRDEQQQPLQTRELLEEEQRLRLQLMEQEQMQLSQLQPSILDQLQLDFLDDEDWSFVDEIRGDGPGVRLSAVQKS